MDDFARRSEQSCHMGVYDRGNVLISAQINSPRGWSFSLQRGARVGLLDTASAEGKLAVDVDAWSQDWTASEKVDAAGLANLFSTNKVLGIRKKPAPPTKH